MLSADSATRRTIGKRFRVLPSKFLLSLNSMVEILQEDADFIDWLHEDAIFETQFDVPTTKYTVRFCFSIATFSLLVGYIGNFGCFFINNHMVLFKIC